MRWACPVSKTIRLKMNEGVQKNIIVFRDNDSLKILDVWKEHLKGLWRLCMDFWRKNVETKHLNVKSSQIPTTLKPKQLQTQKS